MFKANVAKIEARIKKDPFLSQQQIAKEFQITKRSIRNVMKKDLKVKSRARTKKKWRSAGSWSTCSRPRSPPFFFEAAGEVLEVGQLAQDQKTSSFFLDKKVFNINSVSNSPALTGI
jgi:hypothetical protein